jgi:hypothetical protein
LRKLFGRAPAFFRKGKVTKVKFIKGIPTLTFICPMTVLVIMTPATFAIWVPYHFDFFRQQNERLKAELLGKQKQLLKD